MNVHIEVGEKTICYLSDEGLKLGAREMLEGKLMINLFPHSCDAIGGLIDIAGVDPSTVPIVVLPAEDYNQKFPDDVDEEETIS